MDYKFLKFIKGFAEEAKAMAVDKKNKKSDPADKKAPLNLELKSEGSHLSKSDNENQPFIASESLNKDHSEAQKIWDLLQSTHQSEVHPEDSIQNSDSAAVPPSFNPLESKVDPLSTSGMKQLYSDVASRVADIFQAKVIESKPRVYIEDGPPQGVVLPSPHPEGIVGDQERSIINPKLENDNQLIQVKLQEAESLKVAQKKIEELESAIIKLRIENERLAAAGELFQKKAEDSIAARVELEKKMRSNEDRHAEERRIINERLEQREIKLRELTSVVEDYEGRISGDIRKSRSRERELEHRLELARLERLSLVGSKDEIILDLKRQVDQLNLEIASYRKKSAEMTSVIDENQEQFRRTVRALRLALTNLEVNEQIGGRIKKAE